MRRSKATATGRPFLDFGREIRRRRRALKWSIEVLAERADLAAKYIGTIENGHRDPSLSTIDAIANGLGAEPSALIGGLPHLRPESLELGRRFDRASPDIQRAALMILRGVWIALTPKWTLAR